MANYDEDDFELTTPGEETDERYDDYDDSDYDEGYNDEEYYEDYKKNKKRMPIWGLLLIVLAEIAIIGCGIWIFIKTEVHKKYQEIGKVENLKVEDLDINETVPEKVKKGYTTIVLFGVDTREDDLGAGSRSDTMIVCSINNETKEVRMASVYRDTLLEIQGNNQIYTAKVNGAYALGGPELAIKTLNRDLDLNITEYVAVNWEGLTRTIDALGGLEITVKEGEMTKLNQAIAEQIATNGMESDGVMAPGTQILNGVQATAWTRVRSTDQGDITRTERQRLIVNAILQKMKQCDVSTLNKMIDTLLPYVSTSISEDEIYDYVSDVLNYKITSQTGFPFKYAGYDSERKGSCLAPYNLTQNVRTLQSYLYDNHDYQPSQEVTRINSEITAETGYDDPGEIPIPEDIEPEDGSQQVGK